MGKGKNTHASTHTHTFKVCACWSPWATQVRSKTWLSGKKNTPSASSAGTLWGQEVRGQGSSGWSRMWGESSLICWSSFNVLIPPWVVNTGLLGPEPGPLLANTPGYDPFVTSHRVSEEEWSWTEASFCSCELSWPLLVCLNCYGVLPEIESPRWSIRQPRQEVPAFNLLQNQEVKPQCFQLKRA